MRIDIFLDSVCLYKSRTMSAKACQEGFVKLNGSKVKPSKEVKEKDIIEIERFSKSEKYLITTLPFKNVKKSEISKYIQDLTKNSEETN
ncbi:RNA-binding protein [candidate division WOR-3 bacterium]|nr:RNA-binding protein [candidate division WOR-3 bacterium]